MSASPPRDDSDGAHVPAGGVTLTLTARQFERIEELFFQASSLSSSDREAFLDTACSDDPTVRCEVRRMLSHAGGSGSRRDDTPGGRIENALESLAAAPAPHAGSEAPVRQLIGTRIGAYELIDVLGQGGMGVVYLARDIRLNRRVALKFVHADMEQDPATLERFRREARAASSMSSPHICTIYELDEHGGVHYIAMEFVEGRTVGQCAVSASPRQIASWTAQVAETLRVAHLAGIIHRDIKPENILVRPDGLVKVLDFGMARLLSSHSAGGGSSGPAVTQANTLLGTVRYMSPEQARCEPAGAESDVFSLGIVLYELLTRRHPFEAASQVATLQAILSQSPLPPSRLDPAVPPELDQLVLRMLSKDSRLRPAAAEVSASLQSLSAGEQALAAEGQAPSTSPANATAPVGREHELRSLAAAYESAARGRGRVVCVTGEAGIGKTTLAESFLDRLATGARPAPVIARGRCSERLAGAEAYLPVLEAIDGLLRGPERETMSRLVRVVAPSWYAQAAPIAREDSGLGSKVDSDALNNTQERLKRELLTFLEEATRDKPLVLFFDDLHWADPSTVDLLSYLGGKCGSMRLLLLNTYRSSDLMLSRHPLLPVKQELQAKGVCDEVALGMLGRGDVQAYVDREFVGHHFPGEFISFVHQRSSGSPLFMVDLLRYLRGTGALCEGSGAGWTLAKGVSEFHHDLPESVRSMVQRKIDQLSDDERRLLTAASVQGVEFDAAVVSRALQLDPADVEERLLSLDRLYGIVRRIGEKEFADGTLTVHYVFVHVLYQNALYASLQPSRRASLSAAVAASLLAGHNGDGRSAAAEFALLYEAARDFAAAAEYSLHAAGNAARLHAYRESALLAIRGLELLKRLPESPQRNRLELRLQVALGIATQTTSNVFDTSSIASLRRARELCVELGDAARLSVVLWGIWVHHAANGQYRVEAYEYGSELLRLAESTADSSVAMQAHLAMGMTHMHRGEHALALRHFERVVGLHDPRNPGTPHLVYGQHPAVLAYGFGALSLCYSGRLDEWRQWTDEAINLATAIADPPSQSFALFTYLWASQVAGDLDGIADRVEEFHRVSHAHQLALWMAAATVFRGLLLAARASVPECLDNAIDVIRQGITQLRPTHAAVALPLCLAILAEQLIRRGRLEEAFATVSEGLSSMAANGNTYAHAEFHRLRGEVLNAVREAPDRESWFDDLRPDGEPEFADALAIARSQGAKTLEWRVAISLGRWVQRRDRLADADDILEPMIRRTSSQAKAQDSDAVNGVNDHSKDTPGDGDDCMAGNCGA